MSTLTEQATRAAILAAGLTAIAREGRVGDLNPLAPTPDVTAYPTPSLSSPLPGGWEVSNSKLCKVDIPLRKYHRRRAVWLVIDRAAAPLTGNYVVAVSSSVGSATVTYNATASAPADVDALLAGWAAAINAGTGSHGVQAAVTRVAPEGFGAEGDDAIELVPANATGGASDFLTFNVLTGTLAPAAAVLTVCREAIGGTLTPLGIANVDVSALRGNAIASWHGGSWRRVGNDYTVDQWGYLDNWDVARVQRIYPWLQPDYGGDTIVAVTGGANRVRVQAAVYAVIAPTPEP